MAETSDTAKAEALTLLDLLMPKIYVVVTLTFRTTKSTPEVAQILQPGLDRLVKQLPWLAGRVFTNSPSSSSGGKGTPEIRWNEDTTSIVKLIDKGTTSASYDASSSKGMPPPALPTDTWPVASMVDDYPPATGAPVFAASLFRFVDGQGVGLCVCIHHYAVDATAMGEIIRLWAQNVTAEPDRAAAAAASPWLSSVDRTTRLREAVAPFLAKASATSTDEIYARHPEYSPSPPVVPDPPFPECAFKLFKIPITRLNGWKYLCKSRMSSVGALPTTNTLVSGIMWSAITRARMRRDASLADQVSQLNLAVNARPRIREEGFPYLGNAVLIAPSRLPVRELCPPLSSAGGEEEEEDAFVNACEVIGASTRRIDARYVAEVYSLGARTEDYSTIYAGWDLFGARDLTITSWASLDLYETEFGEELGRPEFVRVPPSEIGGICGVLPRRRAGRRDGNGVGEVLEVIVTLWTDDMTALVEDETWKKFAEEV
ncbi:hypothetical protein B0H66DRAFT_360594 [Apodospora peruviana]|uniref:Uncharacterized protein n=1 Tax=Apodospora peruviana TaxID=516989 RepID=A0AAE0HW98_9PEZI|nr:hypothetical protein B0H66DRAFT_360594 [Apodospora peruviana]